MRPSYVLVGYENVHCLRAGALTLRHSRTCGNAPRSGSPQHKGERSANSHLAERQCTKPARHH